MAIVLEELCIEFLFEKFVEETPGSYSVEDRYKYLCEMIVTAFSDGDNNMKEFPYPMLTEYVYFIDEITDEENEDLLKNIALLSKYCKPDDKAFIESFCEKFLNHYRLSKIQKKFMMDVSKNAKRISNEAKEISNEAKESATSALEMLADTQKMTTSINDQIENMEKTKGTIYTEFIAILGIFSALIFGLFGGFQGLSEAIVKLSSNWSIGRVLIIGSGIMMCLTLLIFGLLQWVARITGRKLTSCDCYKNNEECRHSLFIRHRTLFSLVFSFIFIFILGEYIETFEIHSDITKIPFFNQLSWVIPVTLLAIVALVAYQVFKSKKVNK